MSWKRLCQRQSSAGYAADIGGGNDKSGGDGGQGGGGGDGSGEGKGDDEGFSLTWKGWKDRVAADPEFPFKVFTEQVIGVAATVVGDMATRPNWGLNELDFVFATLVVGSIMNFSLMYFLAPVASGPGKAYAQLGLLEKFFAEETLLRMGAPGGHIFQKGFTLQGRLTNLLYKAVMFGSIGMAAGVVGTTLSNSLIALRKKLDPTFVNANPPPPVLDNASVWAVHMGVSSNVRYQLLNGLDMVLARVMPLPMFRGMTFSYRTGNNILGGVSFVYLAKLMGVQKTAAEREQAAAAKANTAAAGPVKGSKKK